MLRTENKKHPSGSWPSYGSERGQVMGKATVVEAFKQFRVHPEFHTLVWPNGADLAPEFLHQNLRVTA